MLGFTGRTIGRLCCRNVELCVTNSIGKLTSLIPSITEYEPLASICYYTGIHSHRSFQLIVEICAVEGSFVCYNTVAELRVGNKVVSTTALPTSAKGILENVGSRVSTVINQRDTTIDLAFYKKQFVTRKHIVTITFNIDRDIILRDCPKNKWYMLREAGVILGRVKLSFHKLEMHRSIVDGLVLQQALLCAQEYKEQGHKINTDACLQLTSDSALYEHEKLNLFSMALEGPLIAKEGGAQQMRYYKALLTEGTWKWCYWSSKTECRADKKAHGYISILSISTVICHPTDYTCFYIKYYTQKGTHDIILKAVDRNRDVWCDAMFLFIAEVSSAL
uniref:CERLI1-like PH domain-containing protein n=1 Tax=Babesia bovis TaxID=5865 RepID=A7AQW4_BABBO|eukprot:XP_001610501.1 hypothetical protein [Babesia bovis T2Bo]